MKDKCSGSSGSYLSARKTSVNLGSAGRIFSAYYQVRSEDTITVDLDMAWNTRDSDCKQLRLPVLKRI